ncbi:spinster family MFS transporter [Sphingomonas jatrophae]|uniref:Sugar phosphate permease n=1 Tax=Sphingomonas jatrophae TaxID=1166337 RepID=A0A1I6M060_9SPHN|nr:MFS transporter [Sphingomonas jatrophae]SFS09080.1 Sugar phosphate permease [Sphingomonas jatrophae]
MAAAPAGAERASSPGWRGPRFALAVFLVAYILSFADRQILSLMVDPIRRDLGISNVQMGLLQGFAFALLYAVAGVPLGMLADRVGRKWLIAAGVVVWSLATGACALAGTFAHLFVARAFVGLGEATLSPAAHSFLSDAFPPARLARAMSIYTLGITIGGGMALMIGGSVIEAVSASGSVILAVIGALRGWQATFLIVAAPGFLVLALVAAVREPARRRPVVNGGPTRVGSLGATLAWLWQERRSFFAIYASSVALGIMGYGMSAWYPSLLIRTHGMGAGEAGRALGVVLLVCGSAGTLFGGRFAERLTLRGHADANLRTVAMLAAAVTLPAVAAPLMPLPLAVLALFAVATFLFNGYFGCSVAAIQLATPPGVRATNAALFLLANSLVGLSIGAAIIPTLDQTLFGNTGRIGPALSITALFAGVLAMASALSGLRAYGSLVNRLNPQIKS